MTSFPFSEDWSVLTYQMFYFSAGTLLPGAFYFAFVSSDDIQVFSVFSAEVFSRFMCFHLLWLAPAVVWRSIGVVDCLTRTASDVVADMGANQTQKGVSRLLASVRTRTQGDGERGRAGGGSLPYVLGGRGGRGLENDESGERVWRGRVFVCVFVFFFVRGVERS